MRIAWSSSKLGEITTRDTPDDLTGRISMANGTIRHHNSICTEHGHARCYLFFKQFESTFMSFVPSSEVSVTRDGNLNCDRRRVLMVGSRTQSSSSFECANIKACRSRVASVDCAMSSPDNAAHLTNNTEYTGDRALVGSASRNTPRTQLRHGRVSGSVAECTLPTFRTRFWVLRDFTHKRVEQSRFIAEVESSRFKLRLCSFSQEGDAVKMRDDQDIYGERKHRHPSNQTWENGSDPILATRSAT